MAKNEDDREDLMREAVALRDRVELSVSGFEAAVTIGFRENSAMSIFFGQDPVYQFDADGRLRRAYLDGLLYRSQHSTLALLKRERNETATFLLRTDLSADGLLVFRTKMRTLLHSLEQRLSACDFQTLRSVPESADHIPRILEALKRIQLAEPWLSAAIRRRI